MKQTFHLFLVFIFTTAISSCFSLVGGGSNTFIKQSANSNHSKKAILFLRQAGATVGDSYQVTITDYQSPFDTLAVGNVFTVDVNNGKAKLDSNAINFKWVSNYKLEISYDEHLRKFIQQKNVDGIDVVYKLK